MMGQRFRMAAAHSDRVSTRRVLVAETDHNIRSALCLVLERMPQFRLVGQSEDVDELLSDSAALEPDLIIIDLDLRGIHVEEHVGVLHNVSPTAMTIALSTHDDQRRAALAAGVTACVSKTESPRKLLEMLNEFCPQQDDENFGRAPPLVELLNLGASQGAS